MDGISIFRKLFVGNKLYQSFFIEFMPCAKMFYDLFKSEFRIAE